MLTIHKMLHELKYRRIYFHQVVLLCAELLGNVEKQVGVKELTQHGFSLYIQLFKFGLFTPARTLFLGGQALFLNEFYDAFYYEMWLDSDRLENLNYFLKRLIQIHPKEILFIHPYKQYTLYEMVVGGFCQWSQEFYNVPLNLVGIHLDIIRER